MSEASPETYEADAGWYGTATEALPVDAENSVLVGRIWDPMAEGAVAGGRPRS